MLKTRDFGTWTAMAAAQSNEDGTKDINSHDAAEPGLLEVVILVDNR